MILSRIWKTDTSIFANGKKSVTRLEKTEITMTFEKLYYNPSHYASYSAVDNLTCAVKPNFSRGEVIRWLESQDVYTLHRPLRKKFPRLHYNITNIDNVWEADLIELRNLKSYNDDYSYLLVIIDLLSKYVWVEPLRDKTVW